MLPKQLPGARDALGVWLSLSACAGGTAQGWLCVYRPRATASSTFGVSVTATNPLAFLFCHWAFLTFQEIGCGLWQMIWTLDFLRWISEKKENTGHQKKNFKDMTSTCHHLHCPLKVGWTSSSHITTSETRIVLWTRCIWSPMAVGKQGHLTTGPRSHWTCQFKIQNQSQNLLLF